MSKPNPVTQLCTSNSFSSSEPPILRAILEECGHNRAAAAQILGIHRATLRKNFAITGSIEKEPLGPLSAQDEFFVVVWLPTPNPLAPFRVVCCGIRRKTM